MPTFSFRVQDGRMVRVQAADQDSASLAAARWARANPPDGHDAVTGYLTTAARAAPFLTELGAGYGAAVRSANDLAHGRPADFGAAWNAARQQQQGVVDAFQDQHPLASFNARTVGTLAPSAAATLALGGAPVAAQIVPAVERSLLQRAGSIAAMAGRNAFSGAAINGTYGFATPGTVAQRAKSAVDSLLPGAAMGVAVPAAAEGLAKIPPVRPVLREALAPAADAVRTAAGNLTKLPAAAAALRSKLVPDEVATRPLVAEGLPLTPGQRYGGLARAAEDAATNLPILGHAIVGARSRGLEALNRAMANHVLAHIGETAPANVKAGADMVAHVQDRLETASKAAADLLPNFYPDDQYYDDALTAHEKLKVLPLSVAHKITSVLNDRLTPTGDYPDGHRLDMITSQLRDFRRLAPNDGRVWMNMAAEFADDLHRTVNALGERQNPDYGPAKSAVDSAWETFLPLRDAAAAAEQTSGIATPEQFKAALRRNIPPSSDFRASRSHDLMSRLAQSADEAMVAPDPTGRIPMRNLLLATLGADAYRSMVPTAAATGGLGLAAAPYFGMARGVANAFEAADPAATQAAVQRARGSSGAPPPNALSPAFGNVVQFPGAGNANSP